MRVRQLAISFICLFFACKETNKTQVKETMSFEFAVMNNEPVFTDEYLYDKVQKNARSEIIEGVELYFLDWNDNNQFKEHGIDFIGVKSAVDRKPIITKIDSINSIKVDGIYHEITSNNNATHITPVAKSKDAELHSITKLSPLSLENGKVFMPPLKRDSTVLYFWATWCKPCVETLKKIDTQKLEDANITFIPIAYNCSGSDKFLIKNNLNFVDRVISEESAKDYNIKSLSKQYSFLRDGKISPRNVDLKNYFK